MKLSHWGQRSHEEVGIQPGKGRENCRRISSLLPASTRCCALRLSGQTWVTSRGLSALAVNLCGVSAKPVTTSNTSVRPGWTLSTMLALGTKHRVLLPYSCLMFTLRGEWDTVVWKPTDFKGLQKPILTVTKPACLGSRKPPLIPARCAFPARSCPHSQWWPVMFQLWQPQNQHWYRQESVRGFSCVYPYRLNASECLLHIYKPAKIVEGRVSGSEVEEVTASPLK